MERKPNKKLSTDELKSLNFLTFELLVKHRVGILMHKIYLEQSPSCISDLFNYNLNIHPHNTRHRHHMHLPRDEHEFIYETFVYQGTHI